MVAAGIAYDPVVDDGAGGVDMIAEQITAPEKSLETVSLSAPRIEVTQLHHQYDTRRVLDGIDLAVAPGEIVALLGPNGSGKTTLFRILSTLMPPQHGVVRIDGHDVATDSLAARGKFGVIFQSPG
ncbi:MAG: ATP-binding cassette domain-containing protein, partial [Planctomycetota bacterium]